MKSLATFTSLPTAFIGQPARPLKRKTRGQSGIRRLPFVAGKRTDCAAPFWSVPATGGYFGGYETGVAMAHAFLKFLRTSDDCFYVHWLTSIARSFMVRFEQEGGQAMQSRPFCECSAEFSSLRGQYCGFFGTVSQWLATSARNLGADLDRLTEQDLLACANAGLGFDDAAYAAYVATQGGAA